MMPLRLCRPYAASGESLPPPLGRDFYVIRNAARSSR